MLKKQQKAELEKLKLDHLEQYSIKGSEKDWSDALKKNKGIISIKRYKFLLVCIRDFDHLIFFIFNQQYENVSLILSGYSRKLLIDVSLRNRKTSSKFAVFENFSLMCVVMLTHITLRLILDSTPTLI